MSADFRFIPHIDNLTVLDASTELLWTRADVGSKRLTWNAAEKAIQKLNKGKFAGFDDWRLPTVHELFGLIDVTRTDPAIDVSAFPSCAPEAYWTGTPHAWNPASAAWAVYFYGGGGTFDLHRDYDCRVRAVRGPVRQ